MLRPNNVISAEGRAGCHDTHDIFEGVGLDSDRRILPRGLADNLHDVVALALLPTSDLRIRREEVYHSHGF